MKIFLTKQLNGTLKPSFDSDWEKLKKLKLNKEYLCTVSNSRNIKFHRKFFALIKMIFDNQEIYKNADRLRKDLLIEAGYFNSWVDLHGEEHKEAKSISFSNTTELEFSEMYSRVLDEIVKYFNFGKQEIIDNVEQYF